MKLRLTPLNIIIALLLVYFGLLLFQESSKSNSILSVFVIAFAVILCIVDLIFRIVIPYANNRKLWLIQSVFIIFVAILTFLLMKL